MVMNCRAVGGRQRTLRPPFTRAEHIPPFARIVTNWHPHVRTDVNGRRHYDLTVWGDIGNPGEPGGAASRTVSDPVIEAAPNAVLKLMKCRAIRKIDRGEAHVQTPSRPKRCWRLVVLLDQETGVTNMRKTPS